MTEPELNQLLSTITPPDEAARAAAHAHWAGLAKPLGGLGALETLLEDAAALTGSAALDVSRRAVLVLCSDNTGEGEYYADLSTEAYGPTRIIFTPNAAVLETITAALPPQLRRSAT